MLAIWALVQREIIRFWRERSRVAGFVLTPLLFWFVVSSGFGDFSRFFTGSLTLTIMFASVFSNMSLIEDRREGFLKSMLVSPAPRWALVAGKVIGSALLAWAQGLVFLCFVWFTGLEPTLAGVLGAAWGLLLIAIAFTALGFTCAWLMNSTAGFHAVINLLLMPAWMISGALFPRDTAAGWLRIVMSLNPLGYALALMDRLLNPAFSGPSLSLSLTVTAATALLMLTLAWLVASRPDTGE
jgi:ABC-2 type transport system permease protein